MRALLFSLLVGACALLEGAQAPVLYTDSNLDPALLRELEHGQDLGMSLDFDQAESVIRSVMARAPEHPLGRVFLLATLLSRAQEDSRRGQRKVPESFIQEANALIAIAEEQHRAFPHSAYPHLYLGAGYGARGLARLYIGAYFSSYRDGKRGVDHLKKAVALEPELYNAYMGLGQFEYYCGTLGSVLQFLLALPGDPDKGLAMLKTCEEKATYAAGPCKAFRVRLIINDRKDFAAVEPELAALVARYPGNYDFAKAVFQALDSGLNTAALRRSAAEILRRVEHGWTPPPHARFDAQAASLSLGVAHLNASQRSEALPHLERAAQGPRSALAQRATELLSKP